MRISDWSSDVCSSDLTGRDPALAKTAARVEASDERNLYRNVAADFVNRHAKRKNRSWQETARLLGLRPDPDTDGELKPIKGGLADNKKWGARRVQEIARRDNRELIDGIEERGAPLASNGTLAPVRKTFKLAGEGANYKTTPVAA